MTETDKSVQLPSHSSARCPPEKKSLHLSAIVKYTDVNEYCSTELQKDATFSSETALLLKSHPRKLRTPHCS